MMQEISERQLRALEWVDNLPGDLRQCVHEYGTDIVRTFLDNGVTKPSSIRHLVNAVRIGARASGQKPSIRGTLDCILADSGSCLTAMQLIGLLFDNSFLVVPREPSPKMVAASLNEVSGFNVKCTKPEKHLRRLRKAVLTGALHTHPFLEHRL